MRKTQVLLFLIYFFISTQAFAGIPIKINSDPDIQTNDTKEYIQILYYICDSKSGSVICSPTKWNGNYVINNSSIIQENLTSTQTLQVIEAVLNNSSSVYLFGSGFNMDKCTSNGNPLSFNVNHTTYTISCVKE